MFYEHQNRAIETMGIDKDSCVAEQCRKMIDEEFDDLREYWRGKEPHRKQEDLYRQATDNMIAWYSQAHEYSVNPKSIGDLRDFLGSHRRCCVWAVLLAFEHAQRKS